MYRDDEPALRAVRAQLAARARSAAETLARYEAALARRGVLPRAQVVRRLRWVAAACVVAVIVAAAAASLVVARLPAPMARRLSAERALARARARIAALRRVVGEHRQLSRWIGAARGRAALRMMQLDASKPTWAWRVLGLWACLRADRSLLQRALARLPDAPARRALRADCSGLADGPWPGRVSPDGAGFANAGAP